MSCDIPWRSCDNHETSSMQMFIKGNNFHQWLQNIAFITSIITGWSQATPIVNCYWAIRGDTYHRWSMSDQRRHLSSKFKGCSDNTYNRWSRDDRRRLLLGGRVSVASETYSKIQSLSSNLNNLLLDVIKIAAPVFIISMIHVNNWILQ